MTKVANLKLAGDVKEFRKFLKVSRFERLFATEIRKATIKNALFLTKRIKQQIRNREFQQNKPLTLALAEGSIPLLKNKNLSDAISHKLESSFKAEVGIIQNSRSTGSRAGERKGKDTIGMKKLVTLMEEGYTIDVTRKMIQAIMAEFTSDKTKSGRLKKSAQQVLDRFEEGRTNSGGEQVWRVPPRRVFSSVFEDDDIEQMLRANWREALERAWKKLGAKDGEHKER